ncbi:mycofactocin biosynthesis peptidyl-dipeptidase MftE [Saccharopolyspora sp. TS4A08]|uniref:Mycofactocin biosynthesis peptidyl-dipeptidase MftE n=1 Tax=Saccharopolyspora ipomoeae TaxID=3042027 RepID=A0ABT6PQI2_9PSEU|nr:mycofactocin biosynthesis peptidyl-dipeptidase MftE [Saccharopolyspora sp. TS4A08]MDI2030172.1 mycofactocin biosynthesis peptidyl-dipeptidase MftE [Saccharopolyspora sp. TS4A08]
MTGTTLADATWQQAGGDLLLVPVGSLEQHGPHLPLDTDTAIAVAVANGTAARLAEHGVTTWVAPALTLGSSGEHQHFAGTLSIGTEVLQHMVVELVRSARTWVPRVVLVNAHGGNARALTLAVTQLVREGHEVAWLPCRTEEVDLHAGCTETSLMLHLHPNSVRVELAEAGNTGPLAEILPAMIDGGVIAVSPNGVLGDPAGATAEQGRDLLEMMIADTVQAVLASEDGPPRKDAPG